MPAPIGSNLNSPVTVIVPNPVRREDAREAASQTSSGQLARQQQEDRVTLSYKQNPDQAAVTNKKPSLPVSNDEKKSLLTSKKSEHSFSVYG